MYEMIERQLVERLRQHEDFHPIHLDLLKFIAENHAAGKLTDFFDLCEAVQKSVHYSDAFSRGLERVKGWSKKEGHAFQEVDKISRKIKGKPITIKEYAEFEHSLDKGQAEFNLVHDALKLLETFGLVHLEGKRILIEKASISSSLNANNILTSLKAKEN